MLRLSIKFKAINGNQLVINLKSYKNRVCLSDYNHETDLENRLLLNTLNHFELNVLEELLFSSITTSITRLSKELEIKENVLLVVLKKIEKTKLFKIDKEIIYFDKKMRKYFELEFARFEENFKFDLSFLNNLLHKVPIHILPIWYSIPKTSNNIFESIILKYFKTPSVYEKHLENFKSENEIYYQIIQKLYSTKNLEIKAKDLQEKCDLSDEAFLKHIIFLELNFICSVSYSKTDNGFEMMVNGLHEYKKYKNHLNKGLTNPIENTKKIIKKRNDNFAFVKDLSSILNILKNPLLDLEVKNNIKSLLSTLDPNILITSSYINSLIHKLKQVNYVIEENDTLQITENGKKWNKFTLENKALHLYNDPKNIIDISDLDLNLCEKSIREAEKSIISAIDAGWLFFDDFIKGLSSPITNNHQIVITHLKSFYNYSIPVYTKDEIKFFKKIIFQRLFEVGIIDVGSLDGKDCFSVTKFGKSLFDFS